ncbi:MAG: A/G-specific adenine glycosylase [Actinobacteria bacterium]|nr:A/G-specific adenine glycosylase [Actinomycetota bacterium]
MSQAPTAALLAWYDRCGRDLPWRRTTDPYAILVSEVMLQQTQVARVAGRYEAWLERWPTAAALAAAPLADVLGAWVGLGYNRRALRLREACAIVARDGWPDDLSRLPGVGPYTAAAVGAFAFGRDEVAMDTNLRRVLARTGGALRPSPGRFGAFNHAVMDLGATVCTARRPRCQPCPLRPWCPSRDAVEVLPARPPGGGGRVRIPFEDTDRHARGRVVAAFMVGLDDEVILIASGGVVIRVPVRGITSQGRDATGVRVMALSEGQSVAAVAPALSTD